VSNIEDLLRAMISRIDALERRVEVLTRNPQADVILRSSGTALPTIITPQSGGTMALTSDITGGAALTGGTAGYAAFWGSGTAIVPGPLQLAGTALLSLHSQLQGTFTIPGPGTAALTSVTTSIGARVSGGTAGYLAGWASGTALQAVAIQMAGTALLTFHPQLAGTFTVPGPGTALLNSGGTINGSLYITGSIVTEAWISPSLLYTWIDYNIAYNPVGYYLDEMGVVHLRGMVKGGTIPSAIFQLPVSYRPSNQCIFSTLSNSALGRIDVTTTGNVMAQLGNAAWITLDGITFRV
jgi:hypothetical protein